MADTDFFNNLPENKQNQAYKEFLITTTKYLKPVEFSNSANCFYYKLEYINQDYNKKPLKELAAIVALLMKREFLLPIRFLDQKIKSDFQDISLTFADDLAKSNITYQDFESFEIIQEDEIQNLINIGLN